MTIETIRTRIDVYEKLWNRYHDNKHMKILLQQICDDIVFFLDEKLPEDLEDKLDQLIDEVNDNDYK